MQKTPLAVVCLSLTVGILLANFLALPGPIWLTLSCSCWLAWWASFRNQKYFSWLLLLSVALAAAARYQDHWHIYSGKDVAALDLEDGKSQPAVLRCRLLTAPELSELPTENLLATIPQGSSSRFYVEATEIRDGQEWQPTSGRLAARADGHVLGYSVGDEVEIFGSLMRLPAPMNPGEADRRAGERNRRTVCRLRITHPDCIQPYKTSSQSITRFLGSVRSDGLALLDRFVGEPHAPLASALLLGARERLDTDKTDQFFHTGTIHLLAISGLHVGILAWVFFFFSKRTQARRYVLVTLMLGAAAYCYLTGHRAPVLRAVILVQIICLGAFWRRKISPSNALCAAAILILAYRPGSLFLPGAQLSFLAVATLIWLRDNYQPVEPSAIEKLVLDSRPWFVQVWNTLAEKMLQLFAVSCAIWIVTLPLVMHWFHLCSPISICLNLLLSIPIAIGLLSGFGILVTGGWLEPAASIFGSACSWSLSFADTVVGWSHELPGAFFWVAGPSQLWCSVFYGGLAMLYFVPSLKTTKLSVVAWLASWLAIGIVVDALPTNNEPALECTFLSVGHGTCVVMQMPDDRVIIYDAGRMGVPRFGTTIVSEYLWSKGISHVDAVVISHADADHYNLVPSLIERFSIGQVFVAAKMFEDPSGGVKVLHESILDAKIPIRKLKTNDRLRFEAAPQSHSEKEMRAAEARVLHPLVHGVIGSDNANSIVLEIDFQGHRILLPGDLESPGLDDVMAEMPRDTDLVMAPHHGSLRSAPASFAAWSSPEFVVISGGHDKSHNKVIRIFEDADCDVLHTAIDGATIVNLRNGNMSVIPFCHDASSHGSKHRSAPD